MSKNYVPLKLHPEFPKKGLDVRRNNGRLKADYGHCFIFDDELKQHMTDDYNELNNDDVSNHVRETANSTDWIDIHRRTITYFIKNPQLSLFELTDVEQRELDDLVSECVSANQRRVTEIIVDNVIDVPISTTQKKHRWCIGLHERILEAQSMRSQGMSYQSIADAMKLNVSYAWKLIKKNADEYLD
jgi:hypothetical protein